MEQKTRMLTLYDDKRMRYIIGKHHVKELKEQTSDGWDIFLAEDLQGEYMLKVKRRTYTIKK